MKSIRHLLLSLAMLFVITFQTSAGVTGFGDTLGAFNAGILTPTPDRVLRGIEFAEGYFWATGSDPDDLWQHKLYKFSADGQTLVDFWEYGLEFASWGDLAYDGEHLWVTDVDTIRQLDMETGQKTGVWFKAPQYYNFGLAYDPATDHFWISGDNSIIYECDKQGNIVNSVPFPPDQGAAGLAWDTWSEGGPYLWVWSMKYTPSDVRPKAVQVNTQTGTLTGVSFEGVLMNPQAPYAADGALGATITDQLIEDKVAFVGLHGSSYQVYNDQLDWVVYYDLDTEGTGLPGPEINVTPESIQNDLMPGDSIDIPLFISNLDEQFDLNWFANLEYPGMWDSNGLIGDTLSTFDATALTAPDTNRRMRGIAYIGDFIYITTSSNFDNQFQLYKIKKDGSEIVQTTNLFSSISGWTSITSDEQYIYGSDQYVIQEFNPATGIVTGFYPKNSFSADGIAYDPQQEYFYLGNSNGAVKIINKDGDEINFFVTPYEIEALSWDSWTPGGPFLWAYYPDGEGNIRASRLNPNTAAPTGVGFDGIILSTNPDYVDTPKDIIVTRDWQENKLVMIALHDSYSASGAGADQVIVYDLATTPPPKWIELINPTFGVAGPLETDTLFVRLKAIMQDTLMEAQIVINSNDVLKPKSIIPVNFRMMPEINTGILDKNFSEGDIIEQIYPNPAGSSVQVLLRNKPAITSIRLYNQLGKLVLEKEKLVQTKNFSLDVSNLPKGFYQIVVRSGNAIDHRKLIIH
jgi:DNA-binding beta-propeller fold protein YncE